MTNGDAYRVMAAEFHNRSSQETDPRLRAELKSMALGYLRLAQQADRNGTADLVYETPSRPDAQQQQQQQIQPKAEE